MKKNNNIFNTPETKFTLIFIVIFFFSYFILSWFGLVPEEAKTSEKETVLDELRLRTLEMATFNNTENKPTVSNIKTTDQPNNINYQNTVGEEPVAIKIPDIGVNIQVLNPNTRDNVLLDEYLKKGAVRYIDSALLGKGNVLIFGHSSNWEVVKNPAYKALNDLKKLAEGDEIYVYSKDSVYVYRVKNVSLVSADKTFIDLSKTDNMLTLSTCNMFGAKQERYVAEAYFYKKEKRVY